MKKTVVLLLCAALLLLPCAQAEGGFLDWLKEAADAARGLADEAGESLREAWPEVREAAGEVADGLREAWSGVKGAAGEVSDNLREAWKEAKAFWRDLAPAAAELWDELVKSADEYAAQIRAWITGRDDATQEELKDSVLQIARKAGLSDADADEVWEEIASFARGRDIDVGTAARVALVYLAGSVYSGRELTREDMIREVGNWLEKTGAGDGAQAEEALAGLEGL